MDSAQPTTRRAAVLGRRWGARGQTAQSVRRLLLPAALVLLAAAPAREASALSHASSAAAPPASAVPQAFLGAGPTWGARHLGPAGVAALLHKVQTGELELPKLQVPTVQMPRVSAQGLCNMAAGGVAGAVAAAITCPLEVIKTNLQARANVGSGLHPLSMATRIVREQGAGGLYRGLSLSLMGIIPTRSCYFWAYGASKGALTGTLGDGPVTHMMSAVAAGGLSASVTCPLWMVKTRMQLQGTSLVDTARGIVAQDGVKGLYRGLKASYWGLSEGALQFFMYEQVKRAMKEANDGKDLSTLQYLAAAGGTKGLASIATYPHEVVRTRMREAASQRYRSMFQSIALIAKEEGRRGLYSGLGPHLMRVVPNTAIMFMSFELLSRHLPAMLEERAWEPHVAAAQDRWNHVQRSAAVRMEEVRSSLASVHLDKLGPR
jgi:solute carrier family 25 protein 33/36